MAASSFYALCCALVVVGAVVAADAKYTGSNKTQRKNVLAPTTTPAPRIGVDDADSNMLIELADSDEPTCPVWSDKMAKKLDSTPEKLAQMVTEGKNANLAFEFMVFCVLDGMPMSDRLDMLKSGISFQEQTQTDSDE